MLSLAEPKVEDVWNKLALRLRCPNDQEPLLRSLIAEHIRFLVLASSVREREVGTAQRMHTTRLAASTRRNLACLSSDVVRRRETDDIVLLTLNSMAELGDLVSTGNGFWLPAPFRLIRCPESDWSLVVGGVPREAIEPITGAELLSASVSRFTSRDFATQTSNSNVTQSIDTWLGEAEPLSTWTDRSLETHRQRMSRSQEISADQLELYAPDIARDRGGFGPWVPGNQISRIIDGIRLCRPTLAYSRVYSRPHYLGLFDFSAGSLVLRQAVRIEFEQCRRIQFGFDGILQMPRGAKARVGGDTCVLDLRFGLPAPERRILSLGWQNRPQCAATKHQWMFHRAAVPFIQQTLRRIGVNITVTERSSYDSNRAK